MKSKTTIEPKVQDFLRQALETELGGVEIYATAVRCAKSAALKKEWKKYLEETQKHAEIYTELLTELGIDPEEDSPGREIVRFKGANLVKAMEQALAAGDPEAAQLVAAECVVEAETKCHLNWELVGRLAEDIGGAAGKRLAAAHEEVEDEEDEHLYHTTGWARELWIQHLGMHAVLPPPEEKKDVKTAIGAARAKNAREEMM
jgi:bacterioferritin (cytochrome b1)